MNDYHVLNRGYLDKQKILVDWVKIDKYKDSVEKEQIMMPPGDRT